MKNEVVRNVYNYWYKSAAEQIMRQGSKFKREIQVEKQAKPSKGFIIEPE